MKLFLNIFFCICLLIYVYIYYQLYVEYFKLIIDIRIIPVKIQILDMLRK